MVDPEKIEDIYYSLQGVVISEARVPWVTDLFWEGSPCDRAYSEMLHAYDRLRNKLGNKRKQGPAMMAGPFDRHTVQQPLRLCHHSQCN